jgi:hypothetical protein
MLPFGVTSSVLIVFFLVKRVLLLLFLSFNTFPSVFVLVIGFLIIRLPLEFLGASSLCSSKI